MLILQRLEAWKDSYDSTSTYSKQVLFVRLSASGKKKWEDGRREKAWKQTVLFEKWYLLNNEHIQDEPASHTVVSQDANHNITTMLLYLLYCTVLYYCTTLQGATNTYCMVTLVWLCLMMSLQPWTLLLPYESLHGHLMQCLLSLRYVMNALKAHENSLQPFSNVY